MVCVTRWGGGGVGGVMVQFSEALNVPSQQTGKAKLTARSDPRLCPAVIPVDAGCRLTQTPRQITH